MEYALVGLLLLFLVFLFFETRRKAERVQRVVIEEKRKIAEDSGMTATLGVFFADTQTTVIIGASEQLGVFYYRMLRQSVVKVKSRINLANLARIEFLLNGQITPVTTDSEQPILSLAANDAADRVISQLSADSLRQTARAAMRIIFYDDAGAEKSLEITTFRSSSEAQRYERVKLIKNTVWWTAYLTMASRQARQTRAVATGEAEAAE